MSREQERHRAFLADWVRSYTTREDRYGRAWHRGVYERFAGPKQVLRDDDLGWKDDQFDVWLHGAKASYAW